jgi:predicted O-methyltransferase YrrM
MDRQQFLKRLKIHGKENDIPNISPENATFLRKLIRKNNTSHLLEIGSANGYSTIQFADELEKIG